MSLSPELRVKVSNMLIEVQAIHEKFPDNQKSEQFWKSVIPPNSGNPDIQSKYDCINSRFDMPLIRLTEAHYCIFRFSNTLDQAIILYEGFLKLIYHLYTPDDSGDYPVMSDGDLVDFLDEKISTTS